ncbi:MAG: squalene/phytoene synthase family protein [Rickettsiales bacterium]|nr:squalene/phytoene synthase family protein [Rickettsiales bacterium]
MQANIQHCRKLLREKDYPRYLLSLSLPPKQRERLWVLGAFNVEISRAAETTEIATGAIRLKWWMEALEQPRKHPVVEAIHAMEFDIAPLLAALEAREADIETGYHFADMKVLDAYATATGGFWLPLAETDEQKKWLTQLGQVWVLQGLLWATGYQLNESYSTIPEEVFAAHGIDPLAAEEDITPQLCHIIQTLARRVEETLKRIDVPKDAPLARAIPFLYGRASKMQQTPELALAINPSESRLKMVWKMMFAKQL